MSLVAAVAPSDEPGKAAMKVTHNFGFVHPHCPLDWNLIDRVERKAV
jgi:hypothetical protein